METMEYYGGTYPDPPIYDEDCNEEDDYEGDMADIYYEESLFD